MLIRAAVALAALFGALAPMGASAAQSPGRLEFEVTRNGQPFGRHVVSVRETAAGLQVRNEVSLRAGVGPVTVFRYEHACTETWRDGALQALDCSTLKDGRRTQVRGERTASGIRVVGPDGAETLDAAAVPTSWWTRSVLEGRTLIDTEDGGVMPVRVTRLADEALTVGGRTVQASRYRVQGELTMDIWYDGAGRWVRTAFTARGQRIEYTLRSPLDAAPT